MTKFLGLPLGFIFDLDGVIVDTTAYHFASWKQMAQQLGFEYSLDDHALLASKSRMECLEYILQKNNGYMSDAEKLHWSDVKNNLYVQLIAGMQPNEVLPGVLSFLKQLSALSVQTALISSSKNARTVLQSTELESYFNVVVDGTMVKKSKPDPDRYRLAALLLNIPPERCLVFEDTPQGILGAQQANIFTIGLGLEVAAAQADMRIAGFEGLTPETVLQAFDTPPSTTVAKILIQNP